MQTASWTRVWNKKAWITDDSWQSWCTYVSQASGGPRIWKWWVGKCKRPKHLPCFADTFGFCLGDVVDIAGTSSHMRRSLTICEEQGVSMALVLADMLDHGSCGIWKGLWSPWISSVLFGEVRFAGICATLSTYLSVCLPIFQPFPPKKERSAKLRHKMGRFGPRHPGRFPGMAVLSHE